MQTAAVGYAFVFARSWFDAHQAEGGGAAAGHDQGRSSWSWENPEAAVRISFHMHPESIPAGIPLDQAVRDAVVAIRVRAPAVERQVIGSNRWCEFSSDSWAKYVDMLGLHGQADATRFYTPALLDRINDFDEAKLRAWARSLVVPTDEAQFKDWITQLHAPD